MKKTWFLWVWVSACLGFWSAGCGDPKAALKAEMQAVAKAHAALVYANYTEIEAKAVALKEAVDAFVKEPTAERLQEAKKRWLEARVPYGQSEVYRFYNGPIDQDGLEGRINAWPLDEKFIDYVKDDAQAGIINQVQAYPQITKELLIEMNEKGGETNISTGWHAIEFLLWGQDLDAKGPGARPHTDYVENGTAANPKRRGEYLQRVMEILLEDLRKVKEAWKPETSGNYAASFQRAENAEESIKKILTGMGSLSGAELAGERMEVAYENKDQEDEHSCFSDSTLTDFLENARGIQNAFLGKYGSAGGKGIYDLLVTAGKKEIADKLKGQMEASLTAIQALGGAEKTPFDQLILGADDAPGRVRIKAAIDALRVQTQTIAEAAGALGITVNLNPE